MRVAAFVRGKSSKEIDERIGASEKNRHRPEYLLRPICDRIIFCGHYEAPSCVVAFRLALVFGSMSNPE